ncbi:MAG: hypothetical protein ABEJ05_11035 [Haloglomus sp.]
MEPPRPVAGSTRRPSADEGESNAPGSDAAIERQELTRLVWN